jgi:hypothetical protein
MLFCFSCCGLSDGVGCVVGWGVWGWGVVPLLFGGGVGAGSGLPARSLLDLPMLHERWAAAACPAPPSCLEIGMMWSAWKGSPGFGGCPQIQQVVAVALTCAAYADHAPPYCGLPPLS